MMEDINLIPGGTSSQNSFMTKSNKNVVLKSLESQLDMTLPAIKPT